MDKMFQISVIYDLCTMKIIEQGRLLNINLSASNTKTSTAVYKPPFQTSIRILYAGVSETKNP